MWNESDTVRITKSMDRIAEAITKLSEVIAEANTKVNSEFRKAAEILAERDIKLGQVHFAPYGGYETSCGLPVFPDVDLPISDRRDNTTCFGCRSNFTNPSDADLPSVR